jgi:hypothetical protein
MELVEYPGSDDSVVVASFVTFLDRLAVVALPCERDVQVAADLGDEVPDPRAVADRAGFEDLRCQIVVLE